MTEPNQPPRPRSPRHHPGRRSHYRWILLGMLPFLLGSPALQALGFDRFGRTIVQFGLGLIAVVGIWGLTGERVWFRRGLGLAAAIGGATVLSTVAERGSLLESISHHLLLGLLLLYFGASLVLVLRHVLRERPVDGNKLVGALCAYLFLALFFSVLYLLVLRHDPGAFRGLDPGSPWVGSDLTYFSLVTLTTLGYGDITPASPLARTLATGEAVVGQFYIAVIVAGLVALLVGAPPGGTGRGEEPTATG